MSEQDVAMRRARDLERYHRRVAKRRAKGLCLKCGKRPPAPHRTQCEPCAEKQRAGDLARYHRRTAERIARGLCPKCGKAPPEPGRSQCGPCLAKDAAAGRARDARLRAAGMARRDPEKARIAERRRRERQIAERRAAGLCPECGTAPPAPGRTVCEPCGEEQRAAARARYAKGKAAGKLYGNADQDLMPSKVQEPADFRGFPADLLGINPGRHLPPRMRMRLSVASGKAPGWIEGGGLTARISSFSAGLARR